MRGEEMKLRLIALIVLSMWVQGCCIKKAHDEPAYPGKVRGWITGSNEEGLRGEFVLREGETTNNGKVQVKVVEIKPGDECAEPDTFSYQKFLSCGDRRLQIDVNSESPIPKPLPA